MEAKVTGSAEAAACGGVLRLGFLVITFLLSGVSGLVRSGLGRTGVDRSGDSGILLYHNWDVCSIVVFPKSCKLLTMEDNPRQD
jgi:hypothetical protein